MTATMKMDTSQSHLTERILTLTLDIISLLTGETFAAVRSGDLVSVMAPQSHFLMPRRTNKKEILALISRMIELLFTESGTPEDLGAAAPEDDEVLEVECSGRSEAAMMEDQPTGGSGEGIPAERSPRHLYYWDLTAEGPGSPGQHQSEKLTEVKAEGEARVTADQRPGEESPAHHHPQQERLQGAEVTPVKVEGDEREAELLADHPSSVKVEMTLTIEEEEHSRLISTEHKLMRRRSSEEGCDWSPGRAVEAEHTRREFPGGRPDTPNTGEAYDPYVAPRTLLPPQTGHSEVRPFSCADCRKSFKRRAHLLRHRMSHTGERPYTCLECGKSFMQKDHLISHQRSHTGERPFACAECGKTFGYKANYNAHRKYHTGENLHTCGVCGKRYAEKCLFERHQRRHTGEKPYACALCPYRCVQKSDLLSHHKTHSGERRYQCPVCGKGFYRKCLAQEHLKEHNQ